MTTKTVAIEYGDGTQKTLTANYGDWLNATNGVVAVYSNDKIKLDGVAATDYSVEGMTGDYSYKLTFNSPVAVSSDVKIMEDTDPTHVHDWEFSAITDGQRTATCKNEGCDYHDTPAVLKVSVTNDVIYTGDEINSIATVEKDGEELFEFKTPVIRKGNDEVDSYTEAGVYNVYYLFTIDGEETQKGVYQSFRVVKETVTAATDLVYNDGASLITKGTTTPTSANASLVYSIDEKDGEYSEDIPTNTNLDAGKHTVYYKVMDGEKVLHEDSVDVTIDPIQIVVTAPTAIENLVYTGSPQAIAKAGSLDNEIAKLKYAVTKKGEEAPADSDYKQTLIASLRQTDAGEYTVWYKPFTSDYTTPFTDTNYVFGVMEDDVFVPIEKFPQSIDAAIGRATVTVTAPTAKTGLIYNWADQQLVDAGTVEDSTNHAVLKYAVGDEAPETSAFGEVTSATGKNADSYTVWYNVFDSETGKLLSTDNYEIINTDKEVIEDDLPLSVSASIESLAVTVRAEDASKYVGQDDPKYTFTVKSGDKDVTEEFKGDCPKLYLFRSPANAGETAGTYRIDDYDYASGDLVSNYSITLDDEGKLTIKATDGVPVGLEPTYNGEAQDLVYAETQGDGTTYVYYEGETAPADDSQYTAVVPQETNVGTYKIWYKVAKNGVPTGDAAYVTAKILPAKVTVSAEGYTGTYDAHEHGITVNVSGLIGEDTAKILYSEDAGGHSASTTPITRTDAGTTTVYYKVSLPVIPDTEKSNYVFADEEEAAGQAGIQIDQADLDIWVDDKTINYGEDFTTTTEDPGYWATGLVGSDALEVALKAFVEDGTQYTTESPAGEYDIRPVSIKINDTPVIADDEGVYNGNYNITWYSGTLTVDKIAVTVTWTGDGSYTGTYSGTEQKVVPNLSYEPETATALTENDYTVSENTATNAGSYTATIKLNNEAAENYEIIDGDEYDWSIAKAALTITADDKTIKYNESAKGLTVTGTGFVNGETLADLGGSQRVTAPDYKKGDDIGEYEIVASDFTSDNYDITLKKGTLTVTALELTLTWDYEEPFTYDGKKHSVSASIDDGVVPFLDLLTVRVTQTADSRYKETDAGEYTAKVELTGSSAKNYTIKAGNETLVWNIAARPTWLKWTDTSFEFDGTEKTVGYEFENVVSGESLTAVFAKGETGLHADTYPAEVKGFTAGEGTKTSNYSFYTDESCMHVVSEDTPASKDWIITPCPITIVWPSKTSFEYSGGNQKYMPTAKPNTTIDGVTITLVTSGTEAKNAGGYTAEVTDYTVTDTDTARAAVKSDYELSGSTSQGWTITKKAATVTANDNTISYGDAPKDAGYTVSGVVSGDSLGTVTYTFDYKQNGKPGVYTITPTIAKANANYDITFKTGKLTVNDKVTTLVAQAKAKGSKKAKLSWNAQTGAASYDVYFNKCNAKGKKYTAKKIATVTGTSYTVKKLTKGTCYKYYVVAKDASGNVISRSNTAHFIAGNYNSKNTNAKSIKVGASSISLTKGASAQITSSQKKVKKAKKLLVGGHTAKVRYTSSNPAVATVSANGVVTAVGSGYCVVYVQAVNGIWQTVEVNVQ